MKIHRIGRCLGWLLACWPAVAQAQLADATVSNKGTQFWCSFMENLDLAFNDPPNFAFQLESEHGATGTVTVVATGLSVPFSVGAGEVATVTLPTAVFYPQGSEAVTDFGILISADDSIRVQAIHWREYFSETSAVLPLEQLGSQYLAQCYRHKAGDESAFVVVATEDHTVLTITPSVITLNARPAGVPYTVELDRGQTYQVLSYEDLAGTSIQSQPDKPVAVFGGAKISQVECFNANSHLYDQCLPLDRSWFWGRQFLVAPFVGQSSSVLRVLASENETVVQLGCDTVATLQRGETWTHIFSTPDVLYASGPVAVLQFSRGVACSGAAQNGDPTLLNLLPVEVRTRSALVRAPKRTSNGYVFGKNTLTLLAPAGAIAQVLMNGAPIVNPGIQAIPQQPWEYARIPLQPDSTYRLETGGPPFQAYLNGLDYANEYAHGLAFDQVALDTSDALIALGAPDTVCVDSAFAVTLQGGTSYDLNWLPGSSWQPLPDPTAVSVGAPGPVFFQAAVVLPGECLPRLVYAKTTAVACAPPSDTCTLQWPNAFTPDGDGNNDAFGPVRAECAFVDYQFAVYNRWGQNVFSSRQPYAGWDGRLPGGEDAPVDVYVWTLQYLRNAGGAVVKRVGEVCLLR